MALIVLLGVYPSIVMDMLEMGVAPIVNEIEAVVGSTSSVAAGGG